MRRRRSRNSGGSPSNEQLTPKEAEYRLRVRSLMPITLGYDPFETPANMKRLLGDLASLVLEGKVHHRAASAVRGLMKQWLEVDEHERIDDLEKRIQELEAKRQ